MKQLNKYLSVAIMVLSCSITLFSPVSAADNEEEKETIIIVVSDNHVEEEKEEDIYEEENNEISEKAAEALILQQFISTVSDNRVQFEMYLHMLDEYSEWLDAPEKLEDYYTEDEINRIERMVETETYGADFDSRVNVASVVFNRIESETFPDTVDEVIKPGQFAYGRTNISEDTKAAVRYSWMFGDTTQGALYFHSGGFTSTFNGAEHIMTDNAGHHFY